jgi:hypothetical protein
MGYTHYWTPATNSSVKAIDDMLEFTKKAIELFGKEKIAGWDGHGEPVIKGIGIVFNGRVPEDFETFKLEINSGKWNFCKTARHEYDTLVVACLMYADKKGIINEWSSDGDEGDHEEGKELMKMTIKEL